MHANMESKCVDPSYRVSQPHMASAAEELGQMNADILTRASTLLVDDDPSNISIALEHGVKAVWLNPQKPNEVMKLLEEF
jgi:hypothetical protein